LVVIPSADVQTAAGTLGHFLDKKRGKMMKQVEIDQ
jgi:hypothetical protein